MFMMNKYIKYFIEIHVVRNAQTIIYFEHEHI